MAGEAELTAAQAELAAEADINSGECGACGALLTEHDFYEVGTVGDGCMHWRASDLPRQAATPFVALPQWIASTDAGLHVPIWEASIKP